MGNWLKVVDHYLKLGTSYERLEREYEKHGGLTIGVDFDGTVHDYHKTGESYELVRELLRDLKSINCTIIFWSCYYDLTYIPKFCAENNLPCDGVNTNGIPLPWESRKPFFNALLDDRSGLRQVWEELSLLVHEVKRKKNEQRGDN